MLQTARQVGEWTDGKFDVTFAALSDIWKFDHDQDNRMPAAGRDRGAAAADRLPRGARRRPGGHGVPEAARACASHLGGIGKGYAVDRGVGMLRARGLRDFMIQSGGDMYVAGPARRPPVAARHPRSARSGGHDASPTLELTDATFSTSGDYERFFIQDGRRYHHILDPDTGQPASRVAQRDHRRQRARSSPTRSPRACSSLGPAAGHGAHRAAARCRRRDRVSVGNEVPGLVGPQRARLELLAPPTDAP